MPELIRNNETGFLVNNVDEAVDVVNDLKNINRKTCLDWTASQFSCEKMVNDYFRLYQQILRR